MQDSGFLSTKKLQIALGILSVLGYGVFVFAAQLPDGTAPPLGGYLAGDTILDPGCAPGGLNCHQNIVGWRLDGNSGTDGGVTDFIGTTDAQDFVIKTNGAQIALFGQDGNVAIGNENSTYMTSVPIASGANSFALLSGIASGDFSISAGILGTEASGLGAVAFGQGSIASGAGSMTLIGDGNTSSGTQAVTWQQSNTASGQNSTAFGSTTTASGTVSLAFGGGTTASGPYSTAWGVDTTASGVVATVWGRDSIASQSYATAWGRGAVASSDSATAWGTATTASSDSATAWGTATTASGDSATAWGTATTASGDSATAWGTTTTASGDSATAWGYFTTASGRYSTAFGFNNFARSQLETSLGMSGTDYTPTGTVLLPIAPTDRLFSIGNGDSDPLDLTGMGVWDDTSDAFTILKNGDMGLALDNFEANTNGEPLQVGDGTTGLIAYVDGATGNWMAVSDERKKQNITDLSYGLDTINQLRPVSFDYIRNNEHTIGFLAQEVLQYIPESVGGSDEKGYSMSYSTITPVLVNAVQELDMKIKDIEQFATMQNQTFVQNLIAWLGDVTNGIGSIFSKKIITEQICVTDANGQTCLDRSQVNELLHVSGSDTNQPQAPEPTPDPEPEPEVIPELDPIVEPELIPTT